MVTSIGYARCGLGSNRELLGTVYINHMTGDDPPERVRALYGGNYGRYAN
jgi:hypothetical protein